METLWSTLHGITTIKRQELAKQRDACKALRSDLLGPLDSEITDERERVRLLLKKAGKRLHRLEDGIQRHRKQRVADIGVEKESSQHDEILALAGLSALNIQRFLQQSQYDASIPSTFFTTTEEKFRRALRALEIKYDYATLFSDLVTERSKEHLEAAEASARGSGSADFETVGRQEMLDQRQEWESLAFTPSSVEYDAVLSALEKTFDTPEAAQSLETFRKDCGQTCQRIQQDKIRGSHEMKMLVDGLIASDLLGDSQTSVLKQARNSDTWLCEMADVLNLRLASIERWTWETDAIQLEMRRQLNGKHRVFMLEEISQALLIYHIGINFASSFGRLFDNFYRSAGWKKHTGLERGDQAKWDYFVGRRSSTRKGGISDRLSARFHQDFFLSVLPRHKQEGAGGYGDDSLTDGEMQSRVAKAVATKHGLLHLLVAEGLLADRLGEELVVVQTDFRWFGPSLSHSTIEAVMHFLGVTRVWKRFFLTFLQAPLRFKMDGPQGAIKTRERGIPMSHVLCSLFGEAALFCLDFAVNEATKGKPMFRLHDDVYLWGTGKEMQVAWEALTSLSATMGITLNEEKSGTARLTSGAGQQTSSQTIPSSLPVGPLQWGLLTTKKSGNHFAIDQSSIDEHIVELKRQLESRKSVLAWIKAYNTYMDFFHLHMGKTANAMGQFHVDDCLATIHRINVALCPSTKGNVAAYVKKMISDRFPVDDIPDGFLFFPMICGGLELRNPIISLQALRDNVLEEPVEIVDAALEDEQVEYNRLKKIFDKDGPVDKHALKDRPTTFLSAEEFAVFRREYSAFFLDAWNELLTQVNEEMVEKTAEMDSYLSKLTSGEGGHAFYSQSKQPYWRAVIELYGPEMGETFGGLQVVERDLLPMGMVDLLKGKVRWDA